MSVNTAMVALRGRDRPEWVQLMSRQLPAVERKMKDAATLGDDSFNNFITYVAENDRGQF
jgi:hypothetical protein